MLNGVTHKVKPAVIDTFRTSGMQRSQRKSQGPPFPGSPRVIVYNLMITVIKLLISSPALNALGMKHTERHRRSLANELGVFQAHLLQVKNAFFQEALLEMGERKVVLR